MPRSDYPEENIFGKMRGRYDEMRARRVVKTLQEETLDRLWGASNTELDSLFSRYNERAVKYGSPNRLSR